MSVLRNLVLITLASLPLAAAAAEEVTPRAAANAASGENVDFADIIRSFSKRTGKKFIIDPRVRFNASFAGIDPDKITYEELLATLATNQFATYRNDGYIVVVPDANARQLPTLVHSDMNFKADDNEIVTLLLTPKKACTPHLVPILRPLMPQAAHMAADPGRNSLILSDRVGNLRRIADLVERLDKAATGKADCGPSAKSGS
jgi:general secretion pathway protein D